MKTIILLQLALVISLLFIISCEKAVTNVDMPESKPKLVVYSFLSPGADTIFVEVFLSKPIHRPSLPVKEPVHDAEISITRNDGQKVNLYYESNYQFFYTAVDNSFLTINGQYQLYAKTPGGYEVSATCELPEKNTSLRVVDMDSTQITGITRYRFKVSFDDKTGKPDYYRLVAKAVVQNIYDGDTMTFEYGDGFQYGANYIDASNNDGETFVASSQTDIWTGDDYWYNEKLLGMKFYLLSTDEHYYQYHKSLQNYVSDNPFSEPTLVYSNVNNGLGVIAGYNEFVIEYWFEDEDR